MHVPMPIARRISVALSRRIWPIPIPIASAAFRLAAALAAATTAAAFATAAALTFTAAALTFTAAPLAAAGRLHKHRSV
jgi:hypothetical protein